MRKVLPLVFLSSLVSPRIAPSLTDQRRGSPSQPARSLPLKRDFMPAGSGGAVGAGSAALADEQASTIVSIEMGSDSGRIIDGLLEKGLTRKFKRCPGPRPCRSS